MAPVEGSKAPPHMTNPSLILFRNQGKLVDMNSCYCLGEYGREQQRLDVKKLCFKFFLANKPYLVYM